MMRVEGATEKQKGPEKRKRFDRTELKNMTMRETYNPCQPSSIRERQSISQGKCDVGTEGEVVVFATNKFKSCLQASSEWLIAGLPQAQARLLDERHC